MAVWYIEDDATNSHGWTAVAAWAATTAYSVGQIVRQNAAPTVGNERCWVCVVAGTSLGTEPTWTLTKGSTTAEASGPSWRECTGQSSMNGDATNTPAWAASTNYALASPLIKNTAGTHYFAPTTDAGSSGSSEPTWNTTTGATTTDSGITWTCLGAVGSFAAYSAPHARIATPMGISFMAAGDTAYVSDRHAEIQSSTMSVSSTNGTFANPLKFTCVDHTSVPPSTLATTATVTTTGTGSNLAYQDEIIFYGISFASAYNSTSQYQVDCDLVSCNFSVASGGVCGFSGANVSGMTVSFGGSTSHIRLVGDTSTSRNRCIITNMTLSGTAPTTAFKGPLANSQLGDWEIKDSDLSLCTGNLVDVGAMGRGSIDFINCKLGSGVTLITGAMPSNADFIRFTNCSSSNINYSYALYKPQGSAVHETTTVRTGGASDGTTAVSLNITTASGAQFSWPFVSDPIAIWNESTGSALTATVEIAGGASLNNDDIWMEVEYLSDASSCKGSIISNKRGLLASAAAVTSSSASWGGSPTYTQKLQCTFTPQKKGPVVARIYVGKASATVYVDPMITIS